MYADFNLRNACYSFSYSQKRVLPMPSVIAARLAAILSAKLVVICTNWVVLLVSEVFYCEDVSVGLIFANLNVKLLLS